MKSLAPLKYVLYSLIFIVLAIYLSSCGGETVEVPTTGLITTVKEVTTDQFKIEDEKEVPDTNDSRIIAKYLDGTIDTFTIAQARLEQQSASSGRRSGLFMAASYGFMGYFMGRSMGGYRPSQSAYVDNNTYNRVNSTTGNTVRSTSTRVSRPSRSSSTGHGSGRSSRSFGG